MFEATEINNQNTDWIAFIFALIFFLIATVNYFYNGKVFQSLIILFSKKSFKLYFSKDKQSIFNGYQVFLFVVQVLIFGLFAFFINENFFHFSIFSQASGYFILLGIITSYFVLKYVIGLLIAGIFEIKTIQQKIVRDKLNYLQAVSLWVLPFLFISIYALNFNNTLFIATVCIFIILLVLRYLLFLFYNKELLVTNLFYFILYLCALEIAPLLIIIKLIV